jgi:hypothetical protein
MKGAAPAAGYKYLVVVSEHLWQVGEGRIKRIKGEGGAARRESGKDGNFLKPTE